MSIFKRVFGNPKPAMPAAPSGPLQTASGWSFAILGPAGTTSEVFVNLPDEKESEALAFKLVGPGEITFRGPVPPSVMRDFHVAPGKAVKWN